MLPGTHNALKSKGKRRCRTCPERWQTSSRTQKKAENSTTAMQPAAMMPLTAPWDSPLPSRQSEPNLESQASSTAKGWVGSAVAVFSSFRPQLGCP